MPYPLDRFVLDRDLVHLAMVGWEWKGSVGFDTHPLVVWLAAQL